MYSTVLTLHSLLRWLVILSLCYAVYRAYRGYSSGSDFSAMDNKVRHWTATIAHVQLTLGVLVYVKSPIIKYYFSDFGNLVASWNLTFFGLVHALLMVCAIVLITIGSARAKRQMTPREKFRTILVSYSMALIMIFIAIPWPFSPLANRPYLRPF